MPRMGVASRDFLREYYMVFTGAAGHGVHGAARHVPGAAAGVGRAVLDPGAAAAAAGENPVASLLPSVTAPAAEAPAPATAAAPAAAPVVAPAAAAQRATSASAELADEVARVTARHVRREVQQLMGALRHAPGAALAAPQVVDGGYISSDSGTA